MNDIIVKNKIATDLPSGQVNAIDAEVLRGVLDTMVDYTADIIDIVDNLKDIGILNASTGVATIQTGNVTLTATPPTAWLDGQYVTVTTQGNIGFAGINFTSGTTLYVGDELRKRGTQWELIKLDFSTIYAELLNRIYVNTGNTNYLNLTTSQQGKYLSGTGTLLDTATNVAVSDFIEWGTATQFVVALNGGTSAQIFSICQYDASKNFITGSYAGADITPPSKYAGAVYFRITYRPNLVNQLNFGTTVLAYEVWYAKKLGNKDVLGNTAVYKPDVKDVDLVALLALKANTGGSTKTIAQLDSQKANLNQGVGYDTTTTPASTNVLNPANVVADFFVTNTGSLSPSTPAGSYSVFTGTWGSNSNLIAGFNGVASTIFSIAQYDSSGNYITGSYQGTTVSGAISKVTNAVTFKLTIRHLASNINQVNFSTTILAYEAYYPAVTKKVGNKDGEGISATYKPDLTDTDLLGTFAQKGGSTKTLQQVDNEKATLAQGVGYDSTTIPASTNILNPANVVNDFFVNTTGGISPSTPAGSYSVFTGTWGTGTSVIAGLNGIATTIYSFAQYDSAGTYITGSYQGTTISGAISKVTNAVTFKLTIRNSAAPINQINLSSTILAYEAYYPATSKKVANRDAVGTPATFKPDVTDTALLALVGKGTSSESFVQPHKIYCLCNDLGKTTNNGFQTNNYSSILYSDHFFNFSTRKKAFFRSTKSDKLPVFAPVTVDNATYNEGSSTLTKTITDVIEGEIADTTISFSAISTLMSAVASKFPKILVIGDSTVNGTGSFYPASVTLNNPAQFWSYIKKLNLMYRVQNGNTGFNCLMVGKQSSRSFVYNSTTYTTYAEGRGGWKVEDYLYYATSTNGYTNFFYDSGQSGSVKFSLAKYLANYKTLADDGTTRLTVGSTAGALVTDVNTADVCTPTHVVIQLGFNDLSSDYQTNLPLLIARIKEEFPNMIIVINVIDSAGTYFPDLYSTSFNYSGIDLLGDALHAKMWGLINFVKAQENTANRVFACLNYFVQPTAWGVTTRDINYPESIANPAFQMQQEHGAGSNYHPNTYAHSSWAYHLDSLIKYTSFLYL